MISKLTFGEPLGFLSHGSDFNGFIKSQKDTTEFMSVVFNMPLLDNLLKKNPILKLLGKKPHMLFAFASRIVKERLAKTGIETADEVSSELASNHPDLLSSFIAARTTFPEVMTELRITHYAATNIFAGAYSVARTMSKILEYLISHPEAQERLFQELTDVEAAGIQMSTYDEPMALSLAMRMQFLEALVQEAYRTAASTSNSLDRVVSSSGLTLPNGVQLPPGTTVSIDPAAMARRTDVFGDLVAKFDPARWMKRNDESDAQFPQRRQRMDKCMLTFGHGTRNCIGKSIVQLEMYKLWPELIRNYKVGSR